jgi:hypothetical protein
MSGLRADLRCSIQLIGCVVHFGNKAHAQGLVRGKIASLDRGFWDRGSGHRMVQSLGFRV